MSYTYYKTYEYAEVFYNGLLYNRLDYWVNCSLDCEHFFPIVKYIVLCLLSAAQIVVFFGFAQDAPAAELTKTFITYIILGALFYMFWLNEACFDLEPKDYKEILIDKIGDVIRIRIGEPHPIATFIGSIIGSFIVSLILFLICYYLQLIFLMPIVNALAFLLSFISLIQYIRD